MLLVWRTVPCKNDGKLHEAVSIPLLLVVVVVVKFCFTCIKKLYTYSFVSSSSTMLSVSF